MIWPLIEFFFFYLKHDLRLHKTLVRQEGQLGCFTGKTRSSKLLKCTVKLVWYSVCSAPCPLEVLGVKRYRQFVVAQPCGSWSLNLIFRDKKKKKREINKTTDVKRCLNHCPPFTPSLHSYQHFLLPCTSSASIHAPVTHVTSPPTVFSGLPSSHHAPPSAASYCFVSLYIICNHYIVSSPSFPCIRHPSPLPRPVFVSQYIINWKPLQCVLCILPLHHSSFPYASQFR